MFRPCPIVKDWVLGRTVTVFVSGKEMDLFCPKVSDCGSVTTLDCLWGKLIDPDFPIVTVCVRGSVTELD